jgi:hypothetical protein
MAKQPKGELVPVVVGFNYNLLEKKVAEQVRSSADRIREKVKTTVEDIIDVGNELLAVKEALEHGKRPVWGRLAGSGTIKAFSPTRKPHRCPAPPAASRSRSHSGATSLSVGRPQASQSQPSAHPTA